MLDYLGHTAEARAIDEAVRAAVVSRNGTAEIGGSLGTKETGDWIANQIMRSSERSAPSGA
jgi:isocitrate/isopropylmalate dehydrogenase